MTRAIATDRRSFLTGVMATGAGLLLPRWLLGGEQTVDPNLFVLLADIHVPKNRDHVVKRNGVKPAEKFERTITDIVAMRPGPAGVIVAGDCASRRGVPGDYATLASMIQPLSKAGIPFRIVPGNHDHRDNFWAAFPGAKPVDDAETNKLKRCVFVWETPLANWFLLDSLNKTEEVNGQIGEAQLAWLANALDARPDKPALIVAHHHLDALGIGGLIDTAAFLRVLESRKQVKAYFHGHTHCWNVRKCGNLIVVNLPTTALPFSPLEPCGLTTVRLRSDGATVTLHSLDPQHPKHGEKFDVKWC